MKKDTLPPASKAPAIARAAAILRLLGKRGSPMGVQAIARELGLVPSTCLYVLRALVAEEFVAFDPDTKRYALDAGVLTLARAWLRRDRFNDLAQPALDRLAREFGTTTLGVQVFGLDHIIVTAMSQSGQNFQLSTQVGSRFPALVSATGRCIAAFGGYAPADLKSRFDQLRWDEPPAWEDWLAQIEDARQSGVAVDAGNYLSGVTVIAAPVWKGGRPSHALVMIGIGAALRSELPRLKEALKGASRSLSEQMEE
ncbi:IclR family transcriptional regulator [Novosphingobium panipatense]|uniref:Transcriptional regulator, IclR family n=1 Tax=Novosphingobium panipatense TaxID=428991 RepID=A0ABY1QDC7_9SPHN|nr:helix-turn-helix domain-containing protein [Novosphingobium panipatense]SMP66558.1 transcriptional regulator, IclR family [Novosphingobium panipatense]